MATGSISLTQAMWRGFRGKCPNCGEGHMFGRFLKVADSCDHCGEELFHQRADDFPAYLVMVVVGHLVVPAILAVETAYAPPVWLQLAVWLPVTLFAALALVTCAPPPACACCAATGDASAPTRVTVLKEKREMKSRRMAVSVKSSVKCHFAVHERVLRRARAGRVCRTARVAGGPFAV